MDLKTLQMELEFKAIRSSGPGGQHANKVSSKVVLIFNIEISKALTDEEKSILINFLSSKISAEGIFQMSADDYRSQFRNKKLVFERFVALLEKGLKKKKARMKSKPSKASVLKGKQTKKRLSEKKMLRKKPKID